MEPQEPKPQTSVPIYSILTIAMAAFLAAHFYARHGILGALLGFVVGLVPLVNGAVIMGMAFFDY